MDDIIKRIIDNKNDLIEDTFCFKLFEEGIFDEDKCIELVDNIMIANKNKCIDHKTLNVIRWIKDCVDQCFESNNDNDDLFEIKNYERRYEVLWVNEWRTKIEIVSLS